MRLYRQTVKTPIAKFIVLIAYGVLQGIPSLRIQAASASNAPRLDLVKANAHSQTRVFICVVRCRLISQRLMPPWTPLSPRARSMSRLVHGNAPTLIHNDTQKTCTMPFLWQGPIQIRGPVQRPPTLATLGRGESTSSATVPRRTLPLPVLPSVHTLCAFRICATAMDIVVVVSGGLLARRVPRD